MGIVYLAIILFIIAILVALGIIATVGLPRIIYSLFSIGAILFGIRCLKGAWWSWQRLVSMGVINKQEMFFTGGAQQNLYMGIVFIVPPLILLILPRRIIYVYWL